ncbi:MAG: glycosyltransferase family 9 protein [Desulfobacterota bacterium]|nr:glycosyltransferase family 9 protein [Thermodesulfobacteriota bacterium]
MGYQRILILRLSAVGDVIRTLPAVKAIKAHHPSSSISWVVEEPSQGLLESQPEIDEVILFPRKRWERGMKSAQGLMRTAWEVLSWVRLLRSRRFDLVLDFHGILKSGLLSFFSGSPKRIGYGRRASREGNFLFSNVRIDFVERVSRYEKNFRLLKGMGLEIPPQPYPVFVPKPDRDYINHFFDQAIPASKGPLIAIHPGTSRNTPYKRWFPGHYAQLADRLTMELGATVLYTWGPEELDWVKEIQGRMKGHSLLGPRTFSLTQLAEVYRRCHLYIGGDTGPMHLASLMGIPVVVLYGPTDPVVNEPIGIHKKVVKKVGCNPCRERSCRRLTCLEEITVEDVFKATEEVLSLST